MSKKVESLLDFYRDVLASLNIQTDDQGLLSLVLPMTDSDEPFVRPCAVNDKRLALPIPERLRTGDWDNMVAFHPLSEHTLRGESEVFQYLRTSVLFKLRSMTSQLMSELLALAIDSDRHASLTPKQAEYLTLVPDANEKTLKALTRILKGHFHDLINIYMQRQAVHGKTEYRRVAAVSFPIWDELTSKGSKVFDVDCGSVKNKRTLEALFEYIFDNPDEPDAWSYGSNANVAPYFQALMGCYHKVAQRLNGLIHKYRKYLDNDKALRADLDWYGDMQELEKWKAAIPALPGNMGAAMKGEREPEAAEEPARSPKHRSWQPDPSQIAQQAHASTNGHVDDDEPPFDPDVPNPPRLREAAAVSRHPQPTTSAPQNNGPVDWRQATSQLRQPPQPPMGGGQYWGGQPQPAPPPQSHMQLQPRGAYGGGYGGSYGGGMPAPAAPRPWGGQPQQSNHMQLQPPGSRGMYPGQL